MLKIITSFFLVVIVASSCLAGGKGSLKDINAVDGASARLDTERKIVDLEKKVADLEEKARDANVYNIDRTQVVSDVKQYPCEGFAAGFHGAVPTVSYDDGSLDLEIGYTKIAGDQSGLVRAGWKVWDSEDKWTVVKLGGAMFPGTVPVYGVYAEAEQYLTRTASVLGTIYPVKFGDADILSQAAIGGRIRL